MTLICISWFFLFIFYEESSLTEILFHDSSEGKRFNRDIFHDGYTTYVTYLMFFLSFCVWDAHNMNKRKGNHISCDASSWLINKTIEIMIMKEKLDKHKEKKSSCSFHWLAPNSLYELTATTWWRCRFHHSLFHFPTIHPPSAVIFLGSWFSFAIFLLFHFRNDHDECSCIHISINIAIHSSEYECFHFLFSLKFFA